MILLQSVVRQLIQKHSPVTLRPPGSLHKQYKQSALTSQSPEKSSCFCNFQQALLPVANTTQWAENICRLMHIPKLGQDQDRDAMLYWDCNSCGAAQYTEATGAVSEHNRPARLTHEQKDGNSTCC